MVKKGLNSVTFDNVFLSETATICGPKENDGPLGEMFDASYPDLYCGQDNWEQAEMQLLNDAIDLVLLKNQLSIDDISSIFCGDLNNQIAVSNYAMKKYPVPFIGIYGACTSSILTMITGATFIDSMFGNYAICATSSHNSTSERQFRYPTEYGGQRPNSMTYTATGAAAGLISRLKSEIKISRATFGRVIDSTLNDVTDMGRTMAIAAFDTYKQHIFDFNTDGSEYDLVVTGDLSYYGSSVFKDLLKEHQIPLNTSYNDCGIMLYQTKNQKVGAGGSGCACCALVTYAYLTKMLKKDRYKKILVIATGALMNPIMVAQGETIPVIAHAVALERI